MDSMIKEINENLKAIIDTIKEMKDNSVNTLDNIQMQMDKKVEEAKKYKIQVDSAKEKIKDLEDENRSLELSLTELSDKYGKLNLVSVVEAGNREIKNKINDNLKEINKQKEHIAELTNRARTIKDLLMNLKKDKSIKESRLENIKVVYNYYNDRINEVIDYAFDHSENLMDYKNNINIINYDDTELVEENKSLELENTMVFDEIANIDENKNFKDEMTFINDQINNTLNEDESDLNKIDEIIKNSLNDSLETEEVFEKEKKVELPIDTTQVFDTILNDLEDNNDTSELEEEQSVENEKIEIEDNEDDDNETNGDFVVEEIVEEPEYESVDSESESNLFVESNVNEVINDETVEEEIVNIETGADEVAQIDNDNNNQLIDLTITNEEKNIVQDEDNVLDDENMLRINKINDLFANFENNTVPLETINSSEIKGVEEKIDDAYLDIFGKPLEEDDLNKKEPTLTDIFGNPVTTDELSNNTKIGKKLEELFIENGIDFNKFREDEKKYLKQIYDEEKFNNILNTLKRNKINLDNIYNAFNIFGEITANELENLISKLLNVGQSVEAIGLILEKLPKVKKYNLSEAIISYGDYVKNVDITELIMKAKELYKNGGNN